MPWPKNPIPSYSLHKPSGQAVAKVTGPDGKRRTVYLGRHGSPESRQEYERLLATLRTGPAPVVPTTGRDVTVAEALLAYAKHVQSYYPGDSARGHFDALRPVRVLAGALPLREFTPRAYKAVRQTMIDAGQSRTTINGRMQKVGQFVK